METASFRGRARAGPKQDWEDLWMKSGPGRRPETRPAGDATPYPGAAGDGTEEVSP